MHSDGVNEASNQRDRQDSKPRATIGKIQQQQETYREKQLKAREEREERRNNLSSTHRYVIDFAAKLFNIGEDVVEEGILDSPLYCSLLNSLLNASGCRAVIFHYLEADYPPLESGRIAISTPRDLKIKRVMLSNGTDIGIKGEIVLCYRTDNTIELDAKSVEELCFTYFGDVDDAPLSTLQLINFYINQVSRPSVGNFFSWSEAKRIKEIETMKPKLLNGYDSFINFLSATESNLEDRVFLSVPTELEKIRVNSPQLIFEASENPKMLSKIEETFHIWGKEIEKLLTKNDLIRRETAEAGPLSELEHWRKQCTKFGSIVEQIKGPICVGLSLCLQHAKAKYFKTWKSLNNKITDCYNEAFDNVKYLSAMEKYCLPLYSNDPSKIRDCLPSLIYVIRMIYSNSRFYNTNERITALFVKVTNQILISCRNYLTNEGKSKIWDQKKRLAIEKMEVCLKLYERYYSCYQEMQRKMQENPDEKCFECSEMHIFGKYETFKTRLERVSRCHICEHCDRLTNDDDKLLLQLIDILEIFLEYSILQSSCLEGIETFAKRFLDMQKNISSKTYDALDHRKPYFDQDYLEIKRNVGDVEKDLRNFVQSQLSLVPDIHEALRLLSRFEKLKLPSLELQSQYNSLLDKFLKEIEMIQYRYNEEKKDPPIPRYFPPIIGRIMWARNYFKRIEEPMGKLKTKDEVFDDAKGRKVILLYNSLTMILVHYETLYHQAWCKEAYKVRDRLKSPILVYDPNKGRACINFDRYVSEVIRETEGMWKLKLEVPDDAQVLTYQKNQLMGRIERVKALLEINDRLRTKSEPVHARDRGFLEELGIMEEELTQNDTGFPELFEPLMKQEINKMDDALKPGLSMITWTSVNVEEFCLNAEMVLNEVDYFLKEVKDHQRARIDKQFKDIAVTKLVYLPLDETFTISKLLSENIIHQGKTIKELEIKSQAAEEATMELIDRFLSRIDLGEEDELKYQWMNSKLSSTVTTQKSVVHSDVFSASRAESERSYGKSELKALHQNCLNLFLHFSQRFLEALVKATRLSLDMMRKRISHLILHENEDDVVPLIQTDMVLQLPNTTIQPTLEEIQLGINDLVSVVLKTHKGVIQWGQIRMTDEGEENSIPTTSIEDKPSRSSTISGGLPKIKNCFRSVAEHKETVRYLVMLQGQILSLKADVTNLCKSYSHYSYLWKEERENEVKEFVESKPIVEVISEEFQKYENLVEEINNLPEFHCVGPLKIYMNNFKLGLTVEISAWKNLLGRQLSDYYREVLSELVAFIEEKSEILQKPIKDLEDVRRAMLCLDDIRDNFIRIDASIITLEEVYSIFNKFGVEVPKEDIDQVDTISYSFQKLLESSKSVQEELTSIQEPFKQELFEGVAQFQRDLLEFDKDFVENGPMVEGIPAREASDRLVLFQARFDELWQKYETYSGGEKLFGLPVNEYSILNQRKKELNLLEKLYGLYNTVMRVIDGYYDIIWTDIDIEAINNELIDLQLRCRKLPKGLKEWPAYLDLTKKIDDFKETCPLLELMSNKAMKDRHWERIATVTNHTFDIESEHFTLRNVMEAPLLKYKDEVEDICIGAVKERDIDAKLKQVIVDWSGVSLQFSTFKTRGELLLKGQETQEIIASLEDSLMVLGSLLSNRYNTPFKKTIQLWVNNLSNTSEIIENWLVVQNLWIYLEAVFVGGDISKQLPAEAKRFKGIDKTWVRIMERAHERPNVIDCCVGDDTMSQLLPHLLEQLEICQKSLTGYLESKRLLFPRFFFVSDPALLEILGQASDSHTIQAHLVAIFDNVATVEFHEKEYDKIVAVLSRENEKITLNKSVMCTGGVEFWLNTLLQSQQSSLHDIIQDMAYSLSEPEFNVLDMINSYPAQVGLLGIQMIWTRDAENALCSAKTDKTGIMKATNQKFLDLLNLLIDQTTKDLTKFERTKFETLVTIHVHQRDIFDDLCTLRVRSALDFEWLKQARFYFDEDADLTLVKITNVDFIYQNEFLGCTERLVITPLTDRCYITLAQAIGMAMGGAPAGPAGTGKTETTKDMGKALGKYVVVFNCSDQMDFRGLGRIYKGLAQSGSWGCFDEFNRIELPVLSVAAQQINIVLTAKKERKASFIFRDLKFPIAVFVGIPRLIHWILENTRKDTAPNAHSEEMLSSLGVIGDGDTVSLNPEFGIFITMNPGYAGRQELPENLKIMFRTVAMMVPDRQIIMRVKLASCGFKDNINLARKFFTLYKLCEEQLSKQVHYDFGLRNILSVLRTLGAQKRTHPGETEETIVMRVLRDMNMSKLVDEDEPLFHSLIEDLFPGIKLIVSSYDTLQVAIGHQVNEAGLINHPSWNLKVIQLYETSLVRHGLMVMGPTGAGKTSCIHILMKALTETGLPHKEMRMNPKAITAPQMFGRLDVATNDWTDGIFSTLWRKTLKMRKTENVWLVLDGPVDAVWIENLNSVLDDNKTLTLANGDRIVMASNSKILFEPDNVDNASPATVSRMGMVFMSSSVLSWEPIIKGWLKTRSIQEADILGKLFHQIFHDIYLFVQIKLTAKMKVLECIYVRQCGDLLDGLIPTDDSGGTTPQHLERLFLFAIMWSLGALLELDERSKLEEFVRNHPSKLSWPKVKAMETMFEYMVNTKGEWEHWNHHVPEFVYPPDSIPEYSSILVPNVDNIRTAFLINLIAKQSKAVLLIGEQGTAKTVMLKSYMSSYDPEFHLSKSFNFSSATTPNMFQRVIESYVEKRMGTTYGPPSGRKMTVFIDDVNMPVVNEWGDQVTNEIVRQLMETRGFYSLDKPGEFTNIVDIQFLAAMIHPGGGRNDIPPRLKRQFNVFNCTLPSNASIDKIFGGIAAGYFCPSRFNEEVVSLTTILVPLTRNLWQKVKVKMLPTPAKFHYIFNLRDLSRIWEGMLYIKTEECRNKYDFLSLWRHECSRVIADRFTNESDTVWFRSTLMTTAEEILGDDFEHFPKDETYFVDFLRDPPEPTGEEGEEVTLEPPKIYEQIPSFKFVTEKVLQYMAGYNEFIRGSNMDIVFFDDALVHLMKISRIIRTPRGNALLVGVGGSGKQSLARLATFIAGYKIYQITLTRSYNVSNLMDDLKYLYRVSGFEGNGITFLFTENEIKDEAFLEYLNNVLSSGEVANLFAKDEIDEIQSELLPVMKKLQPKVPPTNDNVYNFFISRARNNLHCVLCFSPVGEKFRSRALKFPGLISGCTMDWFSRWPKDALIAVSQHFLQDFEISCTPEVKLQLIEIMGEIQDGVAEKCIQYFERYRRQNHVTPKSFLTFLNGYKTIYLERYNNIAMLSDRMNTGLNKLLEAETSVDEICEELKVKRVVIAEATVAAEKVLMEVTASAEAAEKVKAEVQVVKDKAQTLVDEIAVVKITAQEKLEAALPALEAAEAALLTIKAIDISTVRKLAKPPYLITLIMDAVLILFQKHLDPVKPDQDKQFLAPSWTESLKVMADTKFLSNLQNYHRDKINGETVDLLQPYLEYNLYTYENAKLACGNVGGLIQWTISMNAFYAVNKEVLPLKKNLALQESKLIHATKELNQAQALLDEKQGELDIVQAKFDKAISEKQLLVDDAQQLQDKMEAATELIEGLQGERERWKMQSQLFKSMTERLVGDVILLTGFLSYLGPFNQEYRVLLKRSWEKELSDRKMPVSDNINIIENLIDAATIGEWNLQGLPSDDLSIENGIIVTKAERYPLLIDPQIQGKQWILNKEKNNELCVTSLNHKYFRNHLEDSITLGRPLLIEDIGEELDPILDHILEKNFIKSGLGLKVRVGDKEVDVNKEFRLYITTKLQNPAYTPEVSARTSIIDFTVTMKGLEDQLLGRVILTEKKELEAERVNLIQEVTNNKRKMQELEDNLLYKLTTVQGSLVDDVTVIQVLNTNKSISTQVGEKLKVAAETEVKINNAREEFRQVAMQGSVLYFLICEMSMVNCMYQTSLVQFLEIFDLSMLRSTKSPIPFRRSSYIIDYLTYEVYKYTCRGLYESHKYLFTLLMTLKIDMQRGNVSHQEFDIFVKGGAALDLQGCQEKTAKWISDTIWLNLIKLSSLPGFESLPTKVLGNERLWKNWFDKEAPEEEPAPEDFDKDLDIFRKTLFIRAWCPDRTIAQSRKYVASTMGLKYIEPVILNLEEMLQESRSDTPMICLLSMGSDPTNQIEALAKKLGIDVHSISMGQGQEIHARRLLAESMERGRWILLQNCHLGLEYMSELNRTITSANNIHEQCRVWMTTEVHPYFSISLLQQSIKFTNEPPQGVRAGLKRTYAGMSQDMLDYSDYPQYKPMLHGISFLHTVVQERRKFGPLGWNIPYEFNSADWYASILFVQNHLDEIDIKRGVSWPTVRYMLGEVQYGGRVTDDYDKRLLNTYAKVWFGEHMFAENFFFYKGYPTMRFREIDEYINAIDEMSTIDPPQVYGLSNNADITYQTNTTISLMETIVSIQPKESGIGGGESREVVVKRLAEDMLEKLPDDYDPHFVKERLKLMGPMNSMNIFLRQEIDRMQRVITLVRLTLSDLLLAIEGTIIMNENLRDALDNIYNARVPEIWKKTSWLSSSLGFWFTELVDRNKQFTFWINVSRPNAFWMTGFFNPQGFLTAMRQEVTRAHKGWALDSVTIQNNVTKYNKDDVKGPPLEGVYVHGLYLDGAAWDRKNNRLMESVPKVLFASLPIVHIYAVNCTSPKDPKLYECPVYKKPNRTDLNYVTPLWLPTIRPPEHWILRGAALLCDVK